MKPRGETGEWLNYHHLRHFWAIARHGGMTRAAQVLRVSQSTLSEQLRELEGWLGHALFERRGRGLQLTEAGRIALEHAETIFASGRELLDRMRQAKSVERYLRIGAVGPLSKNLQYDFIEPLLERGDTRIQVVAGSLDDLVRLLQEHALDLVLSNLPVRSDQERAVHNHALGETAAFLVGTRPVQRRGRRFPAWLEGVPLLLPTRQSHLRADFDLLLAEASLEPDVRAEVDDMALLRLLALSGHGLALVPAIVVERELIARELGTVIRVPRLSERFFAITLQRQFGSALVGEAVQWFRERLTSWGAALDPARGRSARVV